MGVSSTSGMKPGPTSISSAAGKSLEDSTTVAGVDGSLGDAALVGSIALTQSTYPSAQLNVVEESVAHSPELGPVRRSYAQLVHLGVDLPRDDTSRDNQKCLKKHSASCGGSSRALSCP